MQGKGACFTVNWCDWATAPASILNAADWILSNGFKREDRADMTKYYYIHLILHSYDIHVLFNVLQQYVKRESHMLIVGWIWIFILGGVATDFEPLIKLWRHYL